MIGRFVKMNLSSVCQNLMEKDKNVLSIILCGSRARGDFKENSDYDIMFITKSSIKNLDKKYENESYYKKLIAKKTKIDDGLIQVYLWTIKYFKEEYKKGNSFIYCALRDGKILVSRYDLNLNLPKNCRKSAFDRLNHAKRNLFHIEFSLENLEESLLGPLELEYLGYSSMHLCWAVCMFNNHIPLSKYTILKECKTYFTEKEFKYIKKTYQLYAKKTQRGVRKDVFLDLFNNLKKIIKRAERKYVRKLE